MYRPPVTRMYQSTAQATDAVAALKLNGYPDDQITVVMPAESSSNDRVMAAIMAGHVLRADAAIYAAGIARGRSLVIVRAVFGMGAKACVILDGFDPVDSGVAGDSEPFAGWDEAAPLSSALSLPLLSRNPTPFSSFWNLPVLSRNARTINTLFPALSSGAAPFSAMLGLPLISGNAAPFSSMLGLPLLGKRR